jgi:hypothetical protein
MAVFYNEVHRDILFNRRWWMEQRPSGKLREIELIEMSGMTTGLS